MAIDIGIQLLEEPAAMLGSTLAKTLFAQEEVDTQICFGDIFYVYDGEAPNACISYIRIFDVHVISSRWDYGPGRTKFLRASTPTTPHPELTSNT